jgi:hypothetical protein
LSADGSISDHAATIRSPSKTCNKDKSHRPRATQAEGKAGCWATSPPPQTSVAEAPGGRPHHRPTGAGAYARDLALAGVDVFSPVKVQGPPQPRKSPSATLLNSLTGIDVIFWVGNGSRQNLHAFNEEIVARASLSNIPWWRRLVMRST